MKLPDKWTAPTPELLAAIVARCKGRNGGATAEFGINFYNGDDYASVHSSNGSQTAKLCERNADAIRAVRCAEWGDGDLTVFFQLDKALLRDLCAVVKAPRSEAQREADRRNGERLAALAAEAPNAR